MAVFNSFGEGLEGDYYEDREYFGGLANI
jgi:hypothetical protein